MKIFLTVFTTLICMASILFSGCYTDTIDAFSEFTVQMPLDFKMEWRNKLAPDTSVDYTDLNDYKEYRDNRDKIKSGRVIAHQFAYWMDSLTTNAGDPTSDQVEFEFVKFYVQYFDEPTLHYLGEFRDVKVKEYYKIPHILPIPEPVALELEKMAKKEPPRFNIISEYSTPKSGGSGRFPHIDGRIDLVIRLKLAL